MKLKKLTVILTAAASLSLFSAFPAFAEETEETTEATTIISEGTVSEDGVWSYNLIKDNATGDEYASLESYTGTDTEVDIPSDVDGNTVRELGQYTFYENENITKISIPDTIEDFGNFPFFACTSLKEFEVDENNEIYTVNDGVLMGEDEKLLVCYPPAKTETEYTIPDSVIALKAAAFATCTNLKTVNFPDTLERMGLYCFAECTSLNNVVIPDSVSELSEFNFTGCTSLTDISLPDTMHTIGSGAFFSCTAMDTIEFPSHLMEIGQAAFVSTGFTEIEVPGTVQEIGYSAFGYTTDEVGQLVAMDSFIVKGLTGSVAQAYCGENEHVSFEATGDIAEEDTTESTQEAQTTTKSADDKETEGMKPGVIVAVCIAGVAVIVLIIIVIKKITSSPNKVSEQVNESSEKEDNDISR